MTTNAFLRAALGAAVMLLVSAETSQAQNVWDQQEQFRQMQQRSLQIQNQLQQAAQMQEQIRQMQQQLLQTQNRMQADQMQECIRQMQQRPNSRAFHVMYSSGGNVWNYGA